MDNAGLRGGGRYARRYRGSRRRSAGAGLRRERGREELLEAGMREQPDDVAARDEVRDGGTGGEPPGVGTPAAGLQGATALRERRARRERKDWGIAGAALVDQPERGELAPHVAVPLQALEGRLRERRV